MPKIATNSKLLPLYKRTIKCPNTFVLKTGRKGFFVEPNSLCGKFSVGDLKAFNLKNWRYKRDKNGNKVPNWNDYTQPTVSAGFAIEHVYDPLNPVCKNECRGRCLEGQGHLAWQSVKRLR
jgi:hypothetical protein